MKVIQIKNVFVILRLRKYLSKKVFWSIPSWYSLMSFALF